MSKLSKLFGMSNLSGALSLSAVNAVLASNIKSRVDKGETYEGVIESILKDVNPIYAVHASISLSAAKGEKDFALFTPTEVQARIISALREFDGYSESERVMRACHDKGFNEYAAALEDHFKCGANGLLYFLQERGVSLMTDHVEKWAAGLPNATAAEVLFAADTFLMNQENTIPKAQIEESYALFRQAVPAWLQQTATRREILPTRASFARIFREELDKKDAGEEYCEPMVDVLRALNEMPCIDADNMRAMIGKAVREAQEKHTPAAISRMMMLLLGGASEAGILGELMDGLPGNEQTSFHESNGGVIQQSLINSARMDSLTYVGNMRHKLCSSGHMHIDFDVKGKDGAVEEASIVLDNKVVSLVQEAEGREAGIVVITGGKAALLGVAESVDYIRAMPR